MNYTIFKQNKYKNTKCQYQGIAFDSKKERDYYIKLKMMEKSKLIKDLKLQVPFILIETFKIGRKNYKRTKYIADFTYLDQNDKLHVIDAKGFRTPEYRLKKKLMAWKYGVEIEEV